MVTHAYTGDGVYEVGLLYNLGLPSFIWNASSPRIPFGIYSFGNYSGDPNLKLYIAYRRSHNKKHYNLPTFSLGVCKNPCNYDRILQRDSKDVISVVDHNEFNLDTSRRILGYKRKTTRLIEFLVENI